MYNIRHHAIYTLELIGFCEKHIRIVKIEQYMIPMYMIYVIYMIYACVLTVCVPSGRRSDNDYYTQHADDKI